jgi:hypothetical protein
VTPADLQALVLGFLQGFGATTLFLLALFIGFCVLLGFPKLRPTSRKSLVIRSLDERIGGRPFEYLPPDAPRGPADQLQTPELVEAKARKSA